MTVDGTVIVDSHLWIPPLLFVTHPEPVYNYLYSALCVPSCLSHHYKIVRFVVGRTDNDINGLSVIIVITVDSVMTTDNAKEM